MNKMTEKQIKQAIDSLVVLVDSREHLPNHITQAFDKYGVNWEKRKLKSGDYSAYIPANKEIGIIEELNFENELCIERKMSADEISTNLSTNKERFHREFDRTEANILILIEDSTYEDIATGNFRSKLTPKQFLGLLHSFSIAHDSPFIFIPKSSSPLWIYNCFKYYFRNKCKDSK